MQPTSNIIVATDMSEHARMAKRRAAILLNQLEINHLELLNIQDLTVYEMLAELVRTSDEEVQGLIKKSLEEQVKELKEQYGISCTYTIRQGRVAQEIADYCEKMEAGLVLVGAHGNSLSNNLFIGSVTEKLFHLTKCPILMVRQPPKESYQNILIAVDFSEECIDMVSGALGLVRPANDIVLLHSYAVPEEGLMRHAGVDPGTIRNFRERARVHAESEMRNLISLFDRNNDLRHVVQLGRPQEVIVNHANVTHPDLIVMSKRASSRAEEMLLGSVSRDVISQTTCDILIIPSRILEQTIVT